MKEKQDSFKSLKFLIINFLGISRFDEILAECNSITPLNQQLIDLLLNQVDYFE